MRYLKDFDKSNMLAVWRYDISDEGDHITIRYQQIPGAKKHLDYPDEKMLISQMHIANIPAVVAAIFRVFQTKVGGSWDCNEHGDNITVAMGYDDHGQFKELIVRDSSKRLVTNLSNRFIFVFEDNMYIHTPLPRTPTPSMIWVTDTLMKIHDEWEKRQAGGKV